MKSNMSNLKYKSWRHDVGAKCFDVYDEELCGDFPSREFRLRVVLAPVESKVITFLE